MVAFRSLMWTGSFTDVVAEVVGFAVADAFFDAAAGEPHAEVARVVVAAVVGPSSARPGSRRCGRIRRPRRRACCRAGRGA